jgi:outer membrane protein TolC
MNRLIALALAASFFLIVCITAAFAEDASAPSKETPAVSHLTLDEAIQLAYENSYELKKEELALWQTKLQGGAIKIAARFKVTSTFSDTWIGPVTRISLGGSGGSGGGSSTEGVSFMSSNLRSLAFSAVQPYSESQRLAAKAVDHAVDAKRQELEKTKDDLRLNVTQAYLSALSASKAVSVAQRALDLANDQLSAANKRFENKVAARFEVIQAEVQVSLATENLAKAKAGYTAALNALFLVMGIKDRPNDVFLDTGPVDNIDDVRQVIDSASIPNMMDSLLAVNKTYNQLGETVRSLDYQIGAARNYPYLSFISSYTNQHGSSLQSKNSYVYGVQVTFNIFDAGASKNQMEQLRAQQDTVSISRDEFVQSFELNLETLADNLNTALLSYETSKKTLERAQEALKISTIGYREGVQSSLDLMQSRVQYLAAEQNVFDDAVAIYLAYDKIRSTIGYDYFSEVMPRPAPSPAAAASEAQARPDATDAAQQTTEPAPPAPEPSAQDSKS